MQGGARGRKGERKTYHITVEFGGYLLNVAKTPTRARAQGRSARGPQKKTPQKKADRRCSLSLCGSTREDLVDDVLRSPEL